MMWRQPGRLAYAATDPEWGVQSARRGSNVMRLTPPSAGNALLLGVILVLVMVGVAPGSFLVWVCLGVFFLSTCFRLGQMDQMSLEQPHDLESLSSAAAGPFALSFLRPGPLSSNTAAAMLLLPPGQGFLHLAMMDRDWSAAGGGMLYSSDKRSSRPTEADLSCLVTHLHAADCQHCSLGVRTASPTPAGLPSSSSSSKITGAGCSLDHNKHYLQAVFGAGTSLTGENGCSSWDNCPGRSKQQQQHGICSGLYGACHGSAAGALAGAAGSDSIRASDPFLIGRGSSSVGTQPALARGQQAGLSTAAASASCSSQGTDAYQGYGFSSSSSSSSSSSGGGGSSSSSRVLPVSTQHVVSWGQGGGNDNGSSQQGAAAFYSTRAAAAGLADLQGTPATQSPFEAAFGSAFASHDSSVVSSSSGSSSNSDATAAAAAAVRAATEQSRIHHSNLLRAWSSAVSLDSFDDNSRALCSVCLGSYREGQLVTTLPCQHSYHKECIYPWLLQQGWQATCPMCKAEVFA